MLGANSARYSLIYFSRQLCEVDVSANLLTGFPSGSAVKNPPAMQETQEAWVRSLSRNDPLEEEMATHSGILAWELPGTGELSGLQSMGSQRVGHD